MTANTSEPPANIIGAEPSPCEHLVQIYNSDEILLAALEGFVSDGIEKGEVVVLIATPGNLGALHRRLSARGYDLQAARERQLYIALDAEESLQKFMIKDWPDQALFMHFVHRILARADGRRVRAFGEMVSLLWARGHGGAMLRLEALWHKICQEKDLSLFCAYPRHSFTQNTEGAIRDICAAHSRVIA